MTADRTAASDSEHLTIAIDAMGGDHAPGAIVEGAIQAVEQLECRVILFGDDAYWEGLLGWVRQTLISRGKVSPADLGILKRARTPEEALALVAESPVS